MLTNIPKWRQDWTEYSLNLIMREEFDDTLQWPFTGKVNIDMYSNKSKQWTQVQVVDFKECQIKRNVIV